MSLWDIPKTLIWAHLGLWRPLEASRGQPKQKLAPSAAGVKRRRRQAPQHGSQQEARGPSAARVTSAHPGPAVVYIYVFDHPEGTATVKCMCMCMCIYGVWCRAVMGICGIIMFFGVCTRELTTIKDLQWTDDTEVNAENFKKLKAVASSNWVEGWKNQVASAKNRKKYRDSKKEKISMQVCVRSKT